MTTDSALDAVYAALPTVGDRGSLREQVAETLRSLLITGQLPPGALCTAPRLAAEFGISVTPVREALLDLVGQGLLEPVRNKGFRVTEIDESSLDDLAELRALIEIPVMAAVAGDGSPRTRAAVEALRPLAEETVRAAQAGDLSRFVTADTEFHLRFLGCHHNAYVVDTVRDLRARSRLFGLAQMAEAGTLAQSGREHVEMVEAAVAGDADRLRALVADHLGQVRAAWAGSPVHSAGVAPDAKRAN